ncbi:DUF1223 domain-containing protein [Wenxinia saemankumensis]|uniref:DUF1223 domain-containing protein n=1 Tax=Wenxinia saemankumensis TaxID=1447782 RepID=A0A1M6EXG6_9RHOB|nr:DUF1223 domain-containing protein [Wenxinia saemankumensis]SHI90125.1 hypothetical protein SAMN05444417_2230 [Wenxinia saemankumensis]
MALPRPAFAAALALAFAGPLAAQDDVVVVELYTSQGCASCPPADALLAELAERDDVLPLALHVDYWDYIGWRDSFGQALFTLRQQSYARAFHERMVYTPQIIVDGRVHTIGNRPMEVMDLIHAHGDRPAGAEIEMSRQGDRLTVKAEAHAPGPYVVQMVRYRPSERVDITAGENAGHSVTYRNIVTEWHVVEEWDGAAPLDLGLDLEGDDPVAILIQRPGPGEIVAAAALD